MTLAPFRRSLCPIAYRTGCFAIKHGQRPSLPLSELVVFCSMVTENYMGSEGKHGKLAMVLGRRLSVCIYAGFVVVFLLCTKLPTPLVVAGSPHEPIVKSIAGDLERRGFVVYVIVSSDEEECIVQSENRLDILPLRLDLATVSLNQVH